MKLPSARIINTLCMLFVVLSSSRTVLPVHAQHLHDARGAQGARAAFAAMLVFDVSGSMAGAYLDSCKSGGHLFVERMAPDDRAGVISFGLTVQVHQMLTSNRSSLHAAIDSLRSGGPTALWDALYLAAQLLEFAPEEHRFIVVVTDGADGSSTRNSSEVMNSATAKGIHITTVGLGPQATLTELEMVARQTGGMFFAVPDASMLPPVYASLIDSLTSAADEPPAPARMALEVFPQPCDRSVFVSFLSDQISGTEFRLTDFQGRVVYRNSIEEQHAGYSHPIPVANLPTGVYFCSVRHAGRVFGKPVLIVH